MATVIDYVNEVIQITSPDTVANAQAFYDFMEDQGVTPVGLLHPYRVQSDPNNDTEIIYPDGKIEDPSNPGVFSQIILKLNPRWQIQFFAGSGVSRWRGGKIVGGLGGIPFKATGAAGDITIVETPVDGTIVVSGSGVTSQDKTDIVNLIFAYIVESGFSFKSLLRLAGALLLGKSSGHPSSPKFRDMNDTKDRVSGTVDANGNRTSVTYDDTD